MDTNLCYSRLQIHSLTYKKKKSIFTSNWKVYAPVRIQNHFTAVNTRDTQQKSAAVRNTEPVTAFIVRVEKKPD